MLRSLSRNHDQVVLSVSMNLWIPANICTYYGKERGEEYILLKEGDRVYE